MVIAIARKHIKHYSAEKLFCLWIRQDKQSQGFKKLLVAVRINIIEIIVLHGAETLHVNFTIVCISDFLPIFALQRTIS